jgi:serine/threonine-protein kinase RsbW
MSSFSREFLVAGTAAELPAVYAFVEASCAAARVDPALCFNLQLAVEEACCNVIEHAYGGQGGQFSITFATRGRDVTITLRDHGRPFDPEQVTAPDTSLPLEQRRIGGLGLHLMYQLMDDVRFSFAACGNVLVMVKRNAVSEDATDAPAGGAHA